MPPASSMLFCTSARGRVSVWYLATLLGLLVVMGQVDEGLRECRIAQRLDSFDEDSALGLYMGRDYDSSIAMLRIMLQKDPKDLYHLVVLMVQMLLMVTKVQMLRLFVLIVRLLVK